MKCKLGTKVHLLGLSFFHNGVLERRTACSMYVNTNGHYNPINITEHLENVTCHLCKSRKEVRGYVTRVREGRG